MFESIKTLALSLFANRHTVPNLEQNPSNSAHIQTVQCGFFLMKKPLEQSGYGTIYPDSAVVAGKETDGYTL